MNADRALVKFLESLIERADIENDVFALGKVIGFQRLLKRMGRLPEVNVQGYEKQTGNSFTHDLLNLIMALQAEPDVLKTIQFLEKGHW